MTLQSAMILFSIMVVARFIGDVVVGEAGVIETRRPVDGDDEAAR